MITHETVFFLRDHAELAQVLRFEGALQAFINSPANLDTWMPVYDAMADLLLLDGEPNASVYASDEHFENVRLDTALYVRVLGLKGKKLTMANFVPEDTQIFEQTGSGADNYSVNFANMAVQRRLAVDPITLKNNEGIDRDFFRRFFHTHLVFEGAMQLIWSPYSSSALDPASLEIRYTENGHQYGYVDNRGSPDVEILVNFHSTKKQDPFFDSIFTNGAIPVGAGFESDQSRF